ncbi:MAG: hypothetical protein ACREV7_18755 [Steroidobacteraceae bacterium]
MSSFSRGSTKRSERRGGSRCSSNAWASICARRAAAAAKSLSRAARRAYAQGTLDQRSLADYETTALRRRIEAMALERLLGEARITLSVELGLGLPQTRIVPLAAVLRKP